MCGLGRVLGTNVASISPVTPKLAVGTEDGSSQPQPGPGRPGYGDDTGQLAAKIEHVASRGQKVKFKSRDLSTPLPFFHLDIAHAKYYKPGGRKPRVCHLTFSFPYI